MLSLSVAEASAVVSRARTSIASDASACRSSGVRNVRSPGLSVTVVVLDFPPETASILTVAPFANASGALCGCSSPAIQSRPPRACATLMRKRASGRMRPSRSIAALVTDTILRHRRISRTARFRHFFLRGGLVAAPRAHFDARLLHAHLERAEPAVELRVRRVVPEQVVGR